MSENCTKSSCESCGADCPSRKAPQDLLIKPGENSRIKKVIGVVSGKGGVGKSLVTSLLATAMQSRGNSCAILDADITGPSIPRSFGIRKRAVADDNGLLPEKSSTGIKIMSINLLLETEDSPVVWRGPVISGVIQQFWRDVSWGDIDCMFVDMPPGTGDVSLTVFQSLPVDGIIIVTTPHDLVTMIVKKAYNIAKLMNVPVIGIVENMSYAVCPDCGKKIDIFGQSRADEVADELQLPLIARIPIDPKTAALMDKGAIELADTSCLDKAAELLERIK